VSEKIKVVVLQILDWMHYVMARLAPNEPEIHDEIDKLRREFFREVGGDVNCGVWNTCYGVRRSSE